MFVSLFRDEGRENKTRRRGCCNTQDMNSLPIIITATTPCRTTRSGGSRIGLSSKLKLTSKEILLRLGGRILILLLDKERNVRLVSRWKGLGISATCQVEEDERKNMVYLL